MAQRTAPLLPATEALLQSFGERLRLARQRRRLTSKQVAERAGMAPMTLRSLERGGSGVTMGAYLAVMQALGIEGDLELLGQADPLGRDLQDSRLPTRRVAPSAPYAVASDPISMKTPKKTGTLSPTAKRAKRGEAAGPNVRRQASRPRNNPGDWLGDGGFSSSRDLAELLQPAAPAVPAAPAPKRRRG